MEVLLLDGHGQRLRIEVEGVDVRRVGHVCGVVRYVQHISEDAGCRGRLDGWFVLLLAAVSRIQIGINS